MGRGELKNEKVAKKRKMKKLLKDASLASLGLVTMNSKRKIACAGPLPKKSSHAICWLTRSKRDVKTGTDATY